jgi:hypothetical protein
MPLACVLAAVVLVVVLVNGRSSQTKTVAFNAHSCIGSGWVCSDMWLVDDTVIIVDNWQQET